MVVVMVFKVVVGGSCYGIMGGGVVLMESPVQWGHSK